MDYLFTAFEAQELRKPGFLQDALNNSSIQMVLMFDTKLRIKKQLFLTFRMRNFLIFNSTILL